jgi:hypothetical protein
MALGSGVRESFKIDDLLKFVDSYTARVKQQMDKLSEADAESIGIGAVFEMQMMMNKLSQASEMCSSVVNASNQAINTMARAIKA